MDTAAVLAEIDAVFLACRSSADNPTPPINPTTNAGAKIIDGNGQQMASRVISCIGRNAIGPSYQRDVTEALERGGSEFSRVKRLLGVLAALRADIEAGFTRTLADRVEDAVFADFTEMARHIARSAHPAPAVVLAVSVLEERVRRLAEETPGVKLNDGKGQPRTFDALTIDLKRPEVGRFRESEYKQMAAWYSLRNDCAHGRSLDTVSKEDAFRLIDGVNDYLVKLG